MGAAGHFDQRIARDIQRVAEIGPAGVQETPGQFVLVGKGDGVDHEINRGPARAESVEGRVQRGIIRHVHIDHEIRANTGRQRFEPFAEGLALVGEGQLCPRLVQRAGDAPGDRAVIGHAHDQAAFSGHCTHGHTLTR